MLKLNNICYSKTKKGVDLVRNVTIEVREADYIVISGQNDAERRALLEIIGVVNAPKTGEVYIDGIELSKHTPNQLTILRRGTFGYLLRDSELDPALTVGENVSLPLVFAGLSTEDINTKTERALNIVGLVGFKDLRVSDLTIWQKNKVLIARAIANNPKVLILSEPCRVQDKTRLAEVVGLLSALNRDGVSVIVESNNDEYFAKAKRRIEISGGTIVELKKERAPREPQKKTKAKKNSKSKTVKQDNNVVVVQEIEETHKQEEILEVKPVKQRKIKVVEEKNVEPKKQENIKTEKPKKAVVDNTEVVKGQDKTEPKKAGRPKKVEVKVETVVEEKPKKAGRPKKEAEDKGAEPVKTTRKKKGVTEDATSND